jgi:alpha/beta hydrolase fold
VPRQGSIEPDSMREMKPWPIPEGSDGRPASPRRSSASLSGSPSPPQALVIIETMDVNYVVVPALIVLTGVLMTWLSIRRLFRLRAKNCPTWRKPIKGASLSVIALVALILAASSGYNAIALYRGRRTPPARFTWSPDANRLHWQRFPNLNPGHGRGGDGLEWGIVQPGLAKTTRVCSYDRAGMGWSDELPPPRDAIHIADELHGLLKAAKIDGRIVLMGASRGGIFIREYASRYPAQVVGQRDEEQSKLAIHENE